MGGAPYLALVYRNAVVVQLAGRLAGVTRDPKALQRCWQLVAAAKDHRAAETALGDAIWEAEAGALLWDAGG
eukprot:Skav207397  [mRNA]  locus=scaffold2622:10413:10628:+ [translate_table: standard]